MSRGTGNLLLLATLFSWPATGEPQDELYEFLAVELLLSPSAISGGQRSQWSGRPATVEVPVYRTTRQIGSVVPPVAYWVPAAWPEVIDRLLAHAIELEILAEHRRLEVEMYRLGSPPISPWES